MKKLIFSVFAVLLAFCACQKVIPSSPEGEKEYALSDLHFDFRIERNPETKGVRTGWLNGDMVFIFLENVSSAYLTVTYDGSVWSTDPDLHGESLTSVSSYGHLTAIYLPYGNDRTPTWNGSAWVFNGTNDYYYLKSEKADFFITDTENAISTLGAYLYMDTADRFVQFFLLDESAEGTIQLACNVVAPAGIGGIAGDGTVSDTSPALGGWMTARAETIGGEKGYYASGKLSNRPGVQYYFAINASGTYKHYYKQRSSALESRGAYQLPAAANWLTVSSTTFVEIAGNKWCSLNAGSTTPWDSGTQFTAASMDGALASDTHIPSDAEWNLLLDRTKAAWIRISLLGTEGFLIMDRANPDNYFFLPCLDYWSTSTTSSTQHYLKTDTEGTHEIVDDDPPANAYVRLMSSLYEGGFTPPEDGGDI